MQTKSTQSSESGAAIMDARLSGHAVDLLRRRLDGERVEITDVTRPLYRELVAAGWMIPLHTFALGRESAYRLTEQACDLRDTLTSQSNRAPSA
jgi:hypothetical protein